MRFEQVAGQVWEAVQAHWAKALLPLVGIVVGWWWGRRHARREWTRKQFLSRLNISLNRFERMDAGHVLRIRTLSEMDMADVLLNKIAVEKVQAATRRTSEKQPILPLGDDNWYVLNAVLNEISEQFAAGQLKQDLGLPVTTGRYVIAMTYEHDGAMRTRKVRAMVIRKDQLDTLFPPLSPEPQDPPPTLVVERENHKTRLRTLRQIAEAYRRDNTQFLEVEISM